MPELLVKLAWFCLAAVHAAPAIALVRPQMLQQLYGIEPHGPAALLLTHRGAMFFAIVAAALWAAFDPGVRRLGALLVAISVIGFLALYARAGFPEGSLRTIAGADMAALVPLAVAAWSAWRS